MSRLSGLRFGAFLLLVLLLAARPVQAQGELPLYQQTPFDLITLKRDGTQHKILPLPVRQVTMQSSGSLRVRLVEDPVDERSISWSEIERIDLFENLVLAEANRLAGAQQFDEAFRHYAYLLDRYPKLEGLDAAVQDFLFANATDFVARQRYPEALSTLEELYRRNNSYVARTGRDVISALSAVAGVLIQQQVSAADYVAARTLLTRLEQQYGEARLPAIAEGRGKVIAVAEAKAAEARKLLEENKLLEAQAAAREAVRIWPPLEGGQELALETLRRYPIATIAVMQRARTLDPSKTLDWAARRAGRLTDRLLVEFEAPGAEGGRYSSPLGTVERSDDYRRITLQLRPPPASGSGATALVPTGYDVSERLLRLADPNSPSYQPDWADLVASVRVSGVFRVEAILRRPHVVPEGLLQIPLIEASGAGETSGVFDHLRPYALAEQDDQLTRFTRRAEFSGGDPKMPAEVRELYFAEPAAAVEALRRGQVYAIDRLFPRDAIRLQQEAGINVRPYALPTLHFLVPNLKNPYLDTPAFRRALVHAIPRQLILDRLLGGQPVAGCRVVTGPFPAGRTPDDPIAYAYDDQLEPRPFDPGVATLLMRMAQSQLDKLAKQKEEPPPQLKPLVLAHPDEAAARFACEIIARQFEAIHVACELKVLPPGEVTDPSGEYDLLYVVMTVSEPVIDAQRLLGRDGLAGSSSPYIALALRQLQEATSWRDVRTRLRQVHELAYSEVTVIPLWQLIEHYAFHENLRGLEDSTVTLYQNVEQWQLDPVVPREQ